MRLWKTPAKSYTTGEKGMKIIHTLIFERFENYEIFGKIVGNRIKKRKKASFFEKIRFQRSFPKREIFEKVLLKSVIFCVVGGVFNWVLKNLLSVWSPYLKGNF